MIAIVPRLASGQGSVDGEYDSYQSVNEEAGYDFQPGDSLIASFDWSFENNDPDTNYTVTVEVQVYDADWNFLGVAGGTECVVLAGDTNVATATLQFPVPTSGYSQYYYFATAATYNDGENMIGGGSVQFSTD